MSHVYVGVTGCGGMCDTEKAHYHTRPLSCLTLLRYPWSWKLWVRIPLLLSVVTLALECLSLAALHHSQDKDLCFP